MDLMVWALGAVLTANALATGWLFRLYQDLRKSLLETDRKAGAGMTYEQAEKLIDLKLAPVTKELANLTRATERLAEVLMERR